MTVIPAPAMRRTASMSRGSSVRSIARIVPSRSNASSLYLRVGGVAGGVGGRFGARVVQILGAAEHRSERTVVRERGAEAATTEMGRNGPEDASTIPGGDARYRLTSGLTRFGGRPPRTAVAMLRAAIADISERVRTVALAMCGARTTLGIATRCGWTAGSRS